MTFGISMCVIPGRERGAIEAVKSLHGQADINIFCPMIMRRTGVEMAWNKEWEELSHIANLTLYQKDNGPIDKIVQALYYLDYDYIITVDDDVRYSDGFVETFKIFASRFPDEALCYRAKPKLINGDYTKSPHIKGTAIKSKPVELITGTWGACYKMEWFDIHELLEMHKGHEMVDDIVINSYLKKHGIKRRIIPCPAVFKPLDNHKVHELYSENHNGINNNRALNELYLS